MTRNTQTSIYDALKEIAGMMIEDGYTAAEVTAVADGLRQIKSALWDEERETGKDLGTKMIGSNAWLLDKVAMYMETYYDDTSRHYEAAAYIDEICAEILDPIYGNDDDEYDDENTAPAAEPDLNALKDACPDFAYCGTDAPEVMAIQEKLRAADDHADADDSWKDNQCFTVIHAIDKHPDNKVVARPTTWREKLEMEDQLHDDGYEFVDTIATGGEIVTLWYRPMMPWPKLREMTKPSTSTEED